MIRTVTVEEQWIIVLQYEGQKPQVWRGWFGQEPNGLTFASHEDALAEVVRMRRGDHPAYVALRTISTSFDVLSDDEPRRLMRDDNA
jgi:hypothetical protein